MKKISLLMSFAMLFAIVGIGVAGPAAAAKGDRTARVAGGEQVTLAKSRFSSRELKARRPQMEALIPKVR